MSKEVGPHGQPESLFVGHVSETVSQIQNESPIISQQQIADKQKIPNVFFFRW